MSTCINGLYIIFHKSPKQKVHGCQTGWVWNVAAKMYPPSLECLTRVLHYISVIVRRRPILLPNHDVYTQLWNNEVFQHIEEHMIHNCSLGLKKMVHNHVFCLQHRKHWPFDCPAHVSRCRFCHPQMIRLWWFTSSGKRKVASSLKKFCPKTDYTLQGIQHISTKVSPT